MNAAILTNFEGYHGIDASIKAMTDNKNMLDVLEEGIREVESNPLASTVGYGGAPNILGEMELDAAIMDGSTLQVGSVGALQGFIHPISVARKVMELLPHVMLVGEGAGKFAEEIKAEKGDNLSDEAKNNYLKWLENHVSGEVSSTLEKQPLIKHVWGELRKDIALGTTVFIALSKSGKMAAATSTSGWAYKYPGRLGDSPIIGAGLYVDSRYGGATCTHTGEMTIRCGTARAIVAYMKKGASVKEACHEALDDLRYLKTGFIGNVVIHAMDNKGNPYVLYVQATGHDMEFKGIDYYFWSEGMGCAKKMLSAVEQY